MTAANLLADCHAREIFVTVQGDRLEIDGPDAELTPDLLARLQAHKPELLEILTPEPPAADCDPPTPGGPDGRPANLQPKADAGGDPHGPAPWRLPPWPPVVPDAIVADPIPDCRHCGRPRVIPGQPGRPAGLCYPCWLKQAAGRDNAPAANAKAIR